MRKLVLVSIVALSSVIGWSADWLTDGGDSQRTHWQKDEKLISPATAKNIKLLWKIQLDSKPRVMTNLYTALITNRVTTKSGPKQVALVAGVTDKLFAIDVDTGTLLWTKQFSSSSGDYSPIENGSILCPGGQTATPYIQASSTPGKYTIFAVSGDGLLHQLNLADGEDIKPPSKFVPPGGKIWALNVVKNVIYTHTSQGCGGNPNVAYAYDLATDKVGSWGPAGGGMWGRTGPAVSPTTGAMYTGTGDGQWRPEDGVYGNGIVGLKQDPASEGAEALRLLRTSQRGVAGQARSGCAGDARDFQLQGQRADGERQQGMPLVAHGHGGDRRRRPSHGSLHDADVLQRRREFRVGRNLGLARDVGGFEGYAVGAEPVLGPEGFPF